MNQRIFCLTQGFVRISGMQLRLNFPKAAPHAAPTTPPESEDTLEDLRAPSAPEKRAAPSELLDLIGGSLGNVISSTFRRMEIAEEEIGAGQGRHPGAARAVFGVFKHLVPTPLLRDMSDELYRLHCRELIERAVERKNLRPGTAAEVVAALAGVSQIAPPTREQTLLYMKLFEELFPERARATLEETGAMEPDRYEEERLRELESRYRRQLSSERGFS